MSDETAKQPENEIKPDAAETPDEIDLSASMSEDELLAAIGDQIAAEADGEAPAFGSPLEALAAENEKQEAEINSLKDQAMRIAADMENLRRRTQKDVADARSFSISGFARDMLSVADNLRRAIDHVSEEDRENSGVKTLIEGVEMTERELHNNMEKHGVKKLEPKGEKFDPNFHQAMYEVPNTEVLNNTVMEVVQVGYVIGERVLRPAMVGISKGGPKASDVKGEAEG